MAEYIEREALEKNLNERLAYLLDKNGPYDYFTDGYDEAVSTVEEYLSADVVPVVHGRWDEVDLVELESGGNELIRTPNAGLRCSNCRNCCKTELLWKNNYCPNCGAKMDGGMT